MLDFILEDGKRLSLEEKDFETLKATLYTESGKYMGEIDWDINSIADFLFTEEK